MHLTYYLREGDLLTKTFTLRNPSEGDTKLRLLPQQENLLDWSHERSSVGAILDSPATFFFSCFDEQYAVFAIFRLRPRTLSLQLT